jgi:hypothetical protein
VYFEEIFGFCYDVIIYYLIFEYFIHIYNANTELGHFFGTSITDSHSPCLKPSVYELLNLNCKGFYNPNWVCSIFK